MHRVPPTPLDNGATMHRSVRRTREPICRMALSAPRPVSLLRLLASLLGLLALAAGTAAAESRGPLLATRSAPSEAAGARKGPDLAHSGGSVGLTGPEAAQQDARLAAVDVSGNIITNTLWSEPVYHVTGPTYVMPDVTLTIAPGTVVKFGKVQGDGGLYPTSLTVYRGTLHAIGTEAEPVVFTSYRDDDHGGDTNGDGSATTPEPGDWYSILFGGGTTGRIRHAWIGYGGCSAGNLAMVTAKSDENGQADVLLEHVTLTKAYSSNGAILAIRNDLTVRHSQFLDNGTGAYDLVEQSIIDARHNWWGYPTGPSAPGNPLGEGDALDESVLYYPWVGDLSTYGKLPATFRLTGPNTASPGQWAPYTISLRSSPTDIIEDAVVVLNLPTLSDHVQSTEGGIFWPERHQVYWKLGDLAPGTEAQLSATAEYVWGIPEGTSDGARAQLAGSNWQQDQLDVDAYLAYEPWGLLSAASLTAGELDSERAAYPDLDLMYTQAITDGFVLAGAARLSITDQVPITQVTLIHEKPSEVMHIRRISDTVNAATYGDETYAVRDVSGGLSMDFQLGTVSTWGSWTGPAESADALAECNLTVGNCFLNYLMDKAPVWLISNIGKAGKIILGSADCVKCYRGDEDSCARCATEWIPLAGEVMDIHEGLNDCREDPTSHICVEAKSYCDRGKGNPYGFFGIGNYVTLECEDCKYQFPPTGRRVCGLQEKCLDCPTGPKCLPKDGCCPSGTQADGGLECAQGSIPQAGDACGPYSSECDTEITIARDPNAKYGVSGAVLPGQTLTYTIEFENEGEGYAYGVFLVDPLDEGLDERTLTIYGDGTYLSSTRDLMWDVGDLTPSGSPGSTGAVSVTVAVSDDLPSGTSIINEALVVFQSVPEETPTNAVVNVVQPVVALPQEVETSYMQAVSVTLEGVEVSGLPLTYTVASDPLFGELEGTPPLLTYTPMANFVGQDAFGFEASNGISSSLPARVRIIVEPSSADVTPPEVMWASPGEGEAIEVVSSTPVYSDSLGWAYGPSILVQFSETMSATAITTDTVQLTRGGGSAVPVSVSYEGWTNRAAITPRQAWWTDSYSVTLGMGIEDASGNGLVEEVEWGFGVTAPEPAGLLYLPLLLKGVSP
jgi:uncharacterized repeat protein (TIGR01451 family)